MMHAFVSSYATYVFSEKGLKTNDFSDIIPYNFGKFDNNYLLMAPTLVF